MAIKRTDFTAITDDYFDEELIRVFHQASREIEQLYRQAVGVGNLTKANQYLKRIKALQEQMKSDYKLWADLRVQEEYLKGALYVEDFQGNDKMFIELTKQNQKNYQERLETVSGMVREV
ncbi:MAG: hypothetical protein LBU27_08930 [Candidatus Peribacteria bacterium]|jgi:hypothetical protein|nr:hypothetical protein [Candidatus Peribacteria bacterium]